MTDGVRRTLVIAEAGVNHNGSLERALRMVRVAAAAGADVVKFQTFRAERMISPRAPKAEYQLAATDAGESQREMIRALELDAPMHEALMAECAACGVEFLSTPFDDLSVELLARLGVARLKLPSGEVTNGPLLLKAAATGLPVILSTGMAMLSEVRLALGALAFGWLGLSGPSPDAFLEAGASPEGQAALAAKATVLHCTTEYPAPFADANLRAMQTLREEFGLPVGFSDHTPGVALPIAAAALGAAVVEKHFTLDRTLPGPDHRASLEPDELARMVEGIRAVESALGDGVKRPRPSEVKNMAIARKSLCAFAAIRAGEPFTEENLAPMRPGDGVSPMRFWDYLGRPSPRDYAPGELVEPLPGEGGEA